jgi:hypothetical protein
LNASHTLPVASATPSSADTTVARWIDHPRLDVLKLVAVVTMFIDHLNTICLGTRFWELRALGRLAFPLFAFILAYNFVRHTHSPARYLARLFAWGVISQVIFWYALSPEMLNIFFTLGAGLLCAMLFRHGARAIAGTILAAGLVAISRFHAPIGHKLDFGIEGVALVFLCAQLIEHPTWWRGGLALLFAGALNRDPNPIFQSIYACAAAISLILVAATARWSGEWRWVRHVRLGFYFFYPAHLFVLKLLAPA